MVRDPAKAAPFAKLGVELVEGDFAKSESWDRALAGVDKVFVITPLHLQAEDWFRIFLDAAKKACVGHVVKLSGWRVSPTSEADVHRQMGRSDDALKASGLGYTILRPNVFFQNMFVMAAPIRAENRFQSAAGDARISMIDVRDIAAVAVKVFAEDGHLGKVYDMSGPESLTYFEIADVLSKTLGRRITYVPLDAESAVKGQVARGIPEQAARARVGVQASFSNGVFSPTSDVVEKILRRPPLPFVQFARDYADRFR
jgi:uncharacterized protein YbjT (DUF2867 family)